MERFRWLLHSLVLESRFLRTIRGSGDFWCGTQRTSDEQLLYPICYEVLRYLAIWNFLISAWKLPFASGPRVLDQRVRYSGCDTGYCCMQLL